MATRFSRYLRQFALAFFIYSLISCAPTDPVLVLSTSRGEAIQNIEVGVVKSREVIVQNDIGDIIQADRLNMRLNAAVKLAYSDCVTHSIDEISAHSVRSGIMKIMIYDRNEDVTVIMADGEYFRFRPVNAEKCVLVDNGVLIQLRKL